MKCGNVHGYTGMVIKMRSNGNENGRPDNGN